ncbi:MAG: PHP domain-containing protein [Candidatus Omnitrophica bacterium]|nr:PHP domain-containing protein [Candidatus Omnitrophota bacterium]
MSDRYADLHIHTCFSDGSDTPEEVVRRAAQAGLSAVGITDHDTVDGVAPAMREAASAGIEVLAGVELSSDYHGKDIHILGYLFDLNDSPLVKKLREMRQVRVDRMKKMVARLAELGVRGVTFEEVAGLTRSDAVGRLHLAQILVAKKAVPSLEAAFERYLGEGAAAYFPKYLQTPFEAIRLIRESGGIAVLAHPMLTQRDELIPAFVKAGLDGLEAYYPNCSMAVANFYVGLAQKHGLLVTGGSDSHGKGKTSTYIGKAFLPGVHLEKMKALAAQRRTV